MQFLSFATLVQANSLPPSVVVDMDITDSVLNSDILKPVVGQYTIIAKLICDDRCVVLC